MSTKLTKKDLNTNRAVKNSRGKLKALRKQDSPKIEQLQVAFEKMRIDDDKPTRKRRASPKLLVSDKNHEATKENDNAQPRDEEKMRINATMKKPMGNNKSSGSSEFDGNQIQGKHLVNKSKRKYVSAKGNKKIMEKSSVEEKNYEKGSNDATATEANEPTASNKNLSASPIPMKVKRKGKISHKNLSKRQNPNVNKDDLDINTEMLLPGERNNDEKGEYKIQTEDKSRKINKTFLISDVNNKGNSGIIDSGNNINCMDGKKMVKMNLSSKTNSPVIALIKRANQSSPHSPIASVSRRDGCATPPSAAVNTKSVDIKKYEKSFSVEERNILTDGRGIEQEKKVEKVFENIGFIGGTSEDQLSVKNSEEAVGCSVMELTYTLREETKGKTQVKDTEKNGKADLSKKSACNRDEERREEKKKKKIAEAFEKLGKRFVSTAKKMGYLDDSTEDSSTDDSEDYSKHSTDCSCSSCTSFSDTSSGTSYSDDFSEYTVSGSSSRDSSTDSSSTD